MVLEMQKAKDCSIDELYQILLPMVNKLYKTYDYAGIERSDYESLIKGSLDKVVCSFDGEKENLFDYFLLQLNDVLISYVRELLLVDDNFVSIVSNYMKKCKKSGAKNDLLVSFSSLVSFFYEIDVVPSIDLIINLLEKNSDISRVIQIIANENQKEGQALIIDGGYNDEIVTLFLDAYSVYSNMEIQDDDFDYSCLDMVDDSLKIYFREMDKSLLSLEEEQMIGRRILDGDEDAKRVLIEKNLRLVVQKAKKFLNLGLDFSDLIQEGSLGLIQAADKYDVRKGYRFSSYAGSMINGFIRRAIREKSRMIRVSSELYYGDSKYHEAYLRLKEEFGRLPTIEELSSFLGFSTRKVKALMTLPSTISFSHLMSSSSNRGNDKDNSNDDFISSFSAYKDDTQDIVISRLLFFEIQSLLDNCGLKDRERKILELKFGLNHMNPFSWQEIAAVFNVSKQGLASIEARAIAKIRESSGIDSFAEYMDFPEKALETLNYCRKEYVKNHHNRYKMLVNEDSMITAWGSKKANKVLKK